MMHSGRCALVALTVASVRVTDAITQQAVEVGQLKGMLLAEKIVPLVSFGVTLVVIFIAVRMACRHMARNSRTIADEAALFNAGEVAVPPLAAVDHGDDKLKILHTDSQSSCLSENESAVRLRVEPLTDTVGDGDELLAIRFGN